MESMKDNVLRDRGRPEIPSFWLNHQVSRADSEGPEGPCREVGFQAAENSGRWSLTLSAGPLVRSSPVWFVFLRKFSV